MTDYNTRPATSQDIVAVTNAIWQLQEMLLLKLDQLIAKIEELPHDAPAP